MGIFALGSIKYKSMVEEMVSSSVQHSNIPLKEHCFFFLSGNHASIGKILGSSGRRSPVLITLYKQNAVGTPTLMDLGGGIVSPQVMTTCLRQHERNTGGWGQRSWSTD